MENINEIIRMEIEEQMKKVFKKMTKTVTKPVKKTSPMSLLNQTRRTAEKLKVKNRELKVELSQTQKKLNKIMKNFK